MYTSLTNTSKAVTLEIAMKTMRLILNKTRKLFCVFYKTVQFITTYGSDYTI